MKKYFLILFLSILSISYLRAEEQFFNKNQVIITEHGIFLNFDGNLMAVDSIEYKGNGIYQTDNVDGIKLCPRCGFIKKNGFCSPGCRGYGPSEN